MKIKFGYFIFLFLFTYIDSFNAYFKCEIFCANDYVDYIISSNGNILPQIQNNISHRDTDTNFVYNFTQILHNFDQQICIHLVNLRGKGGLAFKNVSINEYDITLLNYENFYSCSDCNDETGPKKFVTTSELCEDKNIISTGNAGNYFNTVSYNFCLDPKSDISSFFIENSKINQNYYKGKEVKYIIYDEINNFNIDEIFIINGNENLVYFLDTVSLKITSITNNKGKIYNGNEELSVNSFFNPKYKYLTYKRVDDNGGYIVTITIETKLKNKNIDIRTCETEAKIYLYVPLKNCAMTEYSDNFCQQCINNNYAKDINENKCYDKSEKLSDLYYESSSQIWKNCEKEKNSFICSICPKGTFIKNELGQICEKCSKGEYSNDIDQIKCEKCDKGYYSNVLGSTSCMICPDGYFSQEGADKCSLCEEIIPNCNSCSKQLKCLKCNNEAVPGYDNCTICENEFDWIYLGNKCIRTTICDKYFYKDKNNNNKINCIQDINECPEGMNYLNLDTGECGQNATIEDTLNNRYQLKGKEKELNKYSPKFVLTTWSEAFFEILSRNNYVLEEKDSEIRIVPSENFNNFNQSSEDNDFEECPYLLRTKYKMKIKNNLVVKVIEFELMGKHHFNYHIYDTDNLFEPVTSSVCENKTVYVLSKPPLGFLYFLKAIKEFKLFFLFVEEWINKFNQSSNFSQEFCYKSAVLNKYDFTLKQLREYFKTKNSFICGDNCEFEGGNLTTLEFRCFCPLKEISEQKIYLENFINYKMLTCFKLNFSLNGQENNYFSWVYIFLFMLDIILILLNEMNLKAKLNKMIKYCKEYILKNNSNDDNLKNKLFKKLRFIHLNKLVDNELKKDFEKFISQKIINNPVKKKRIKKQKRNKKFQIKITNEETEGNLRQVTREEIQDNNDDYYYLYLIYVYKKKDRKTFLIKEELNNLDFNLYKNIESRSIFKIYWSIFEMENDFFSTFLIFNDTTNYYKEYRFYIIKIIIYISSLTFSIIINILFYNDETKHKLFEDDNKYILVYNLPRIIISVLAMKIFFKILKNLIDYQDELINLKKNLDLIGKENIECNNSKNINIINSNMQSISDNDRNYSFSKKSLGSDRKLILNPIEPNIMKRSVNVLDEGKKNKIQVIHNTTDNQIQSTNNNITNNIKEETKEEMSRSIEYSFRRNRMIFYVFILIFKLFSWYFISCFCAVYKNFQQYLALDIIYIIEIDLIRCLFTSFYILIIRKLIKRRCCIKIFNYYFFRNIVIEIFSNGFGIIDYNIYKI